MIIDISRPIHTGMPHWPGHTDTHFSHVSRIADGATCNVGRLTLSVHNGTHADAPFHYNARGLPIDEISVDRFVGPARVIDGRGRSALTSDLFAGMDLAATSRILFKTDFWSDPATFPSSWPLLDPALPAWLAERGVQLIGLDLPSVDTLASKDLPMHHALDDAGILILENLDLRLAQPGLYELIALPLRIRDGDGSPVRAVLLSEDGD